MEDWAPLTAGLLWRNALAVIPLAIAVGLACRLFACRPATRHTLWLMVLAWFLIPIVIPTYQPPAEPSIEPSGESIVEMTVRVELPLRTRADVPDSPAMVDARSVSPQREPTTAGEVPAAARSANAIRPGGRAGMPAPPSLAGIPNKRAGMPAPPTTGPVPATGRGPARSELHVSPKLTLPYGSVGQFSTLSTPSADNPVKQNERNDGVFPEDAAIALESEAAGSVKRVRGATAAVREPRSDPAAESGLSSAARPEVKPAVPIRRAPATAREAKSATEELTSAMGERWRIWAVGLAGVRDAIGRLPSIPERLWFIGVGALLAFMIARVVWFQKRLASAMAAPTDVRRQVAKVARRIGLRRLPETVMVDACVSPMIWCGRRTLLVLPVGLWSRLDKQGRRAVLAHELAHLYRRDHWVRRLELLVVGLFWWHPLLWWVRHRLHEEAELCCDAWVTYLLPEGRRAYAEALLRTREFVSGQTQDVPGAAIGITSQRGKHLARRLTMVMTDYARPKMSFAGLLLVAAMASVGWVATPAWSYPDKDQAKSKSQATTAVVAIGGGQAKTYVRASDCDADCDGPCCRKGRTLLVTPGAVSGGGGQTYRRYLQKPAGGVSGGGGSLWPATVKTYASGGVGGGGLTTIPQLATFFAPSGDDDKDFEKRLSRLERALADIARKLESLGEGEKRSGRSSGLSGARAKNKEKAQAEYRREMQIKQREKQAAERKKQADKRRKQRDKQRAAERKARDEARSGSRSGGRSSGGTLIREYKLSAGKVEALWNLMSRSDVPTLVSRPSKDTIAVHGKESDQKIFEAFVRMIHPETRRVGVSGSGRSARSETDAATWERAVARQQEAAQQYVRAAEEGQRAALAQAEKAHAAAEKQVIAQMRLAEAQAAAARKQSEAKGARARFAAQLQARAAMIAAASGHLKAIEKQAAELERHAEQVAEKAEALAEKAEDLIENAEESDDEDAVRKARSRAKQLEAQARAMEKQARDLERQAERLEQQAEQIEKERERLEEQAAEIKEKAAALARKR